MDGVVAPWMNLEKHLGDGLLVAATCDGKCCVARQRMARLSNLDPAPGSRKLGFGRVFVASDWVDASVAASCSKMMGERFGCNVAVAPAPLPTVPRFACVGGCTVIPREMCARLNVLGGRVGNISVPCLWHVVNGDAGLFGLPVENVPCLWHVVNFAAGSWLDSG